MGRDGKSCLDEAPCHIIGDVNFVVHLSPFSLSSPMSRPVENGA